MDEIGQAYSSINAGDYGGIAADWIRKGRSVQALRKLDARYGRPLSWQVVRFYSDLGGDSFGGYVRVRRQRIESIEAFNLSGVQGIDPDLGRVPTGDLPPQPSQPVQTGAQAIRVARPILHRLDWDLVIRRVTAERAGDEWRVICEGTKAGRLQTRYLILAPDGEPVEHVRSRLEDYEDYPSEMVKRLLVGY